MDEINEELEKYYNFAQQQNQQQQMSHQQHMSQQHMNAQQHMNQQQRMNHEQHISQQQHINQQQPMGQQQIHHLGQRIEDSQHGHSGHDSFDQQDLLDLVSTEFYSSAQFTNNEDSSSRILLNSQYKHQSDDQTLFLDQINTSTLPQQINRDSLSSSIPTYIPSSQPFPLNDSLTIDQMQQRRNSELAFNHNSNQQHNNNNNSNNNNNINNNNHNYIFQEHQQQLILNEANSMLSPFEQSQNSLASNNSHSNFQTKPRQERDVFSELITLATKNNPTMRQHNVNNWQNHDNHNSTQGAPHSFSSTEFPSNVQLQIENQHVLQQNQNNKKRSYPDPSSITTAHFAQVKAASEANTSSSSTPKKPNQPKTEKTYNERIYKLSIAQQPSRARMCGFGDKDRRPISPPPIVQLVVTTKDGQVINPETFDVSFLVVICDSCQQIDPIDGDPEFSMYENPLSQVISYPTTTTDNGETNSNTAIRMRNLVGSSVSSATKLYDLQGNFGIFFIFQDVSLRTEGCFRLKFSLIDVGSPYSNCVNTTSVSHVLEVLYTEPFMVYTAKKFPGVVQSTPLSKCFASQGIKIPIRKEKTASTKKPQTANQNSENAEKSDDEED